LDLFLYLRIGYICDEILYEEKSKVNFAATKHSSWYLKRDHSENEVGKIPSVGEFADLALKEKKLLSWPQQEQEKNISSEPYCGDCNFNTYARSMLVTHVKSCIWNQLMLFLHISDKILI